MSLGCQGRSFSYSALQRCNDMARSIMQAAPSSLPRASVSPSITRPLRSWQHIWRAALVGVLCLYAGVLLYGEALLVRAWHGPRDAMALGILQAVKANPTSRKLERMRAVLQR